MRRQRPGRGKTPGAPGQGKARRSPGRGAGRPDRGQRPCAQGVRRHGLFSGKCPRGLARPCPGAPSAPGRPGRRGGHAGAHGGVVWAGHGADGRFSGLHARRFRRRVRGIRGRGYGRRFRPLSGRAGGRGPGDAYGGGSRSLLRGLAASGRDALAHGLRRGRPPGRHHPGPLHERGLGHRLPGTGGGLVHPAFYRNRGSRPCAPGGPGRSRGRVFGRRGLRRGQTMPVLRVSGVRQGLCLPGTVQGLSKNLRQALLQQRGHRPGQPSGQPHDQLVQPVRAVRRGLPRGLRHGRIEPFGPSGHGGEGQDAALGLRIRPSGHGRKRLRGLRLPAPRARAGVLYAALFPGLSALRGRAWGRGAHLRFPARGAFRGRGPGPWLLRHSRAMGRARGAFRRVHGQVPGRMGGRGTAPGGGGLRHMPEDRSRGRSGHPGRVPVAGAGRGNRAARDARCGRKVDPGRARPLHLPP
ncbi:hypothetical protein ASZ90_000135 [hydrocarbon metagenome]|uniref:Uncharacterized protein n=1 Tax=hydrocarbon metagenome TaxID=938273 RepID=A0A0W8GA14_9ZZZZ